MKMKLFVEWTDAEGRTHVLPYMGQMKLPANARSVRMLGCMEGGEARQVAPPLKIDQAPKAMADWSGHHHVRYGPDARQIDKAIEESARAAAESVGTHRPPSFAYVRGGKE